MLAAPDLRAEHPARPAKSVEADHIFALRSAQADRGRWSRLSAPFAKFADYRPRGCTSVTRFL
jgi:hypothetical protein